MSEPWAGRRWARPRGRPGSEQASSRSSTCPEPPRATGLQPWSPACHNLGCPGLPCSSCGRNPLPGLGRQAPCSSPFGTRWPSCPAGVRGGEEALVSAWGAPWPPRSPHSAEDHASLPSRLLELLARQTPLGRGCTRLPQGAPQGSLRDREWGSVGVLGFRLKKPQDSVKAKPFVGSRHVSASEGGPMSGLRVSCWRGPPGSCAGLCLLPDPPVVTCALKAPSPALPRGTKSSNWWTSRTSRRWVPCPSQDRGATPGAGSVRAKRGAVWTVGLCSWAVSAQARGPPEFSGWRGLGPWGSCRLGLCGGKGPGVRGGWR